MHQVSEVSRQGNDLECSVVPKKAVASKRDNYDMVLLSTTRLSVRILLSFNPVAWLLL
jgi:hypothetical protein